MINPAGESSPSEGSTRYAQGTVRAIFTEAQTRLRKPANLTSLTVAIDGLDWFSAQEDGLGDLYQGLLQKNAEDKKSGAGQYFTCEEFGRDGP